MVVRVEQVVHVLPEGPSTGVFAEHLPATLLQAMFASFGAPQHGLGTAGEASLEDREREAHGGTAPSFALGL